MLLSARTLAVSGFAALAGAQRVLDNAHFLSDVFWGAAVGCIFAPLCVYGSRLSRVFDRARRTVARSAPSLGRIAGSAPSARQIAA